MFVSPFADFLYPPPPLYLPHNTMVILGSPRIPRRGMRVARSVAQRSDALREIGPPDLRISCIHHLRIQERRWIQEIRKSGGPISRSASLRATRIIVLGGGYRGGGRYRKSASGESNVDILISILSIDIKVSTLSIDNKIPTLNIDISIIKYRY